MCIVWSDSVFITFTNRDQISTLGFLPNSHIFSGPCRLQILCPWSGYSWATYMRYGRVGHVYLPRCPTGAFAQVYLSPGEGAPVDWTDCRLKTWCPLRQAYKVRYPQDLLPLMKESRTLQAHMPPSRSLRRRSPGLRTPLEITSASSGSGLCWLCLHKLASSWNRAKSFRCTCGSRPGGELEIIHGENGFFCG